MEQTAPAAKRTGLIASVTLAALVLARIYYELMRPHTASLKFWAWEEKWPIVLIAVVSFIVALLATHASQRWLPRRWVFVVAVTTGVIATAPIDGTVGLAAGTAAGLIASIPILTRSFLTAVRFSLDRLAACFVLGTVVGFAVSRGYFAFGRTERLTCYIVAALAALSTIVVGRCGVGLVRWEQASASSRIHEKQHPIVRWGVVLLAVATLVVSFASALWLGREVDTLRRVRALRAAGSHVNAGTYDGSERIWKGNTYVVEASLWEGAKPHHLHLVRAFRDLVLLELERLPIDDADLVSIADLPQLRTLGVYDCPIGDEAIEHFKGHAALDQVVLTKTRCTSRSVAVLAKSVGSLTVRQLSEPCRAEDLHTVAESQTLQWLNLADVGLTDQLLEELTPLPAFVSHLSLADNELEGTTLETLARTQAKSMASRLSSLDLSGNPLELSHLARLESVPLYYLELKRWPAADRDATVRDLAPILLLKNLAILKIPHLQVDDGALRLLRQRVVELEVGGERLKGRFSTGMDSTFRAASDFGVNIRTERLTASDIARLASYDQNVTLHDCSFTPGAIAEFAHHPPRMFQLRDCQIESRFMQTLERYVTIWSPTN